MTHILDPLDIHIKRQCKVKKCATQVARHMYMRSVDIIRSFVIALASVDIMCEKRIENFIYGSSEISTILNLFELRLDLVVQSESTPHLV